MIRAVARVCVWWCFWHAAPPLAVDVEPFRLYMAQCLHIGIRPASDAIGDFAVTIQCSYCTPW